MKEGQITVTKKFNFCYGHHLPGYKGECAKSHGHNAEVEVEFKPHGDRTDVYPTMVIDFKDIKKHVQSIIDYLDHENLNELEFFTENPPTCETITGWIVGRIQLHHSIGGGLVRVRVTETLDSWAEWRAL